MINRELLKKGIEELGLRVTDRQTELMDLYAEALIEANRHINLTRVTDPVKIVTDHYLDSLIAMTVSLPKKGDRLLDIGTGAGFPGVPLAIMNPETSVTMLDSTGKKIKFAETACAELGIKNVRFITGRAEEYAHRPEEREKYAFVYARAVSSMKILAELCIPFAKEGGYFLALKSWAYRDELEKARSRIEDLGGKYIKTHSARIPFTDTERAVIITQKLRKTQKKYPRKYNEIINF